MGRCIERLRDEVLTFVNVRSHRSVIPAPISALHYRDIAFKKKKSAWKWVDKDQDKEEPDQRLFHYKRSLGLAR